MESEKNTEAQAIAGLQLAIREILGLSLAELAHYGPLRPEHLHAVEEGNLEPLQGLYRQYGYNLGRAWAVFSRPERVEPLIDQMQRNIARKDRPYFMSGFRLGARSLEKKTDKHPPTRQLAPQNDGD